TFWKIPCVAGCVGPKFSVVYSFSVGEKWALCRLFSDKLVGGGWWVVGLVTGDR
ncbi:MAG: hypothetical protein RL090_995, partial [Bacteroidota bacterium]